jgi:Ca2+-transporting ATPase
MERKPRDPDSPILSKAMILRILLISLIILLGAFGLFEFSLSQGASIAEARTVVVNVIIFVEIFYLFNARSLTLSVFQIGLFSNPWVIGGTLLMVVIQMAYTYIPVMNQAFGSAPLSLDMWRNLLSFGLAAFLLVEMEKWLRRRKTR